jgi:isoleucyl-tRNA synthetase
MYDFFTLYADVDGWAWDGSLTDPTEDLDNPLDQWIVSRVHQLSSTVDEHMQKYDLANAMKPLLEFVDDASNWYVRRSRKRFWKSDNDGDKQAAYRTLHYVLVQTSMIFAPFTPFLSEELYRNLTGGESVHLLDWPEAGHVNELLIRNMKLLRHLITCGLSVRAEHRLKVRQPLAKITLKRGYKSYLSTDMLEILKEELNVKEVVFDDATFDGEKTFLENLEAGNFSQYYKVDLDTALTPALKQEGLMREVVRQVQNARKQADLQVDDRIELHLETEDKELTAAIKKYADEITAETLATKLVDKPLAFTSQTKVEGAELIISLQKA